MPSSSSLPRAAAVSRMYRAARPWPRSRWWTALIASPKSCSAGRLVAVRVTEHGRAPRLVQRGPVLHPVAERVVRERGVLGEAVGGVTGRPAAPAVEPAGVAGLQLLREVPVVEGDPGGDVPGLQLVQQALVEVQPLCVGRAAPARLDAWPGQREPVRVDAQVRDEPHVLGHPVVMVAGHIAVLAADDHAGHPAVGVPDGRGPAVLGGGALDLVRGGGDAPAEVGGQAGDGRGGDLARVFLGGGDVHGSP